MLPSVFSYSNPGDFLKSAYRALKLVEPGVSHRYIAQVLGMKSSAAFCLLIAGRIPPSPQVLERLAAIFSLNAEERQYLSLLFALRKVDDPGLRMWLLKRTAHPEVSV